MIVKQVHAFLYVLATMTASPFSVLFDDGGPAPLKRYRIAVQTVDGAELLWEEEISGAGIFANAEETAQQIVRFGIDDFVLTKRGSGIT